LGHIAAITGKEFTVAGIKINGDLLQTSRLIEAGYKTFTQTTDSGELKVNIAQMGIDFTDSGNALY